MSEETIHIEEEFFEESNGKAWTEEISVAGNELLDTLKRLIREAAVRKIIVQDESGKTLLEFPLYAGIAGVAVMGAWTAAALIAAWVADLRIVIERVEEVDADSAETATKEAQADASAEPDRCQAVTKSGTQCKRSALEDSEFCGMHQPK